LSWTVSTETPARSAIAFNDVPAYPRSAKHPPAAVSSRRRAFDAPDWWSDLDGGRPVVHVTQGTIANGDLDRLIGPTLRDVGRPVLSIARALEDAVRVDLGSPAPAGHIAR